MEKGLELPPGLGLGRESRRIIWECVLWHRSGAGMLLDTSMDGGARGDGRSSGMGGRHAGISRCPGGVFFPSLFHAGVPFSLSSWWFRGENFPRSPWLELGRWESPGGSGRFPVEQRCSKGPADKIPAVPEAPGAPLLKPGSFGEEGNATTGI